MKVISIAIVRTGSDLNEPIPLSVTNDLSTFGFFQRQVRLGRNSLSMCVFMSVGVCVCV